MARAGGHEIDQQRLHAGGEALDAAGEIAVGDHAGHGDGEAEDGGVERLGDAAGDGEVVGGFAEALENGDETGGGAEQAEQRRDSDDHIEHADAGVELHDLLAGGGLDHPGDVLGGLTLVPEGDRAEAGERACTPAQLADDRFRNIGADGFHAAGEAIRDGAGAGERHGLEADGGEAGDGAEDERVDEDAAFAEEFKGGLGGANCEGFHAFGC